MVEAVTQVLHKTMMMRILCTTVKSYCDPGENIILRNNNKVSTLLYIILQLAFGCPSSTTNFSSWECAAKLVFFNRCYTNKPVN